MCGLAGFLFVPGRPAEAMTAAAIAMADGIDYRGPDDSGAWVDADAGVALSHRRLSIIDVSAAGHQPMASACARYLLAYNGEIYNHLQLRRELERAGAAPAWRGHSDTETLLAGFAHWGVERTLQQAVGMFAIALWDRVQHALVLARDRFGEKPLYYGWHDDNFLFGSDLKALRRFPGFSPTVDRDALTLLLRHACIPSPYSIHAGVRKLPAACVLRVCWPCRAQDMPEPQAYWQLDEVVAAGQRDPFTGSDGQATDALEAQLSESVAAQMLSDVPLGAFLSGGVDSSLVVALMQAHSARPVKTFTIGMGDNGYDEALHAHAVARHLGTDHTTLEIGHADALAVIPQLPTIYSEPFADSSQIPTFLVSRLARQHVTVALSGDGGDELFGGYNRYLAGGRLWRVLRQVPLPARRALAAMLRTLPPSKWDAVFSAMRPLLPRRLEMRLPGDKLHKLAGVLPMADDRAFYRHLCSQWTDPASVVIDAHEPMTRLTQAGDAPTTGDFQQWMMAMDAQTYLEGDILAKVDRAAMANSLETRVPLLDHRVAEFAWRLPLAMKIRDGQGKWLLREVLYRHVPRALIERPKMGFGVPLETWLRGPLRDWAQALLSPDRLRREGYFRPEPITRLWDEHLRGNRNLQHQLWPVLMFQAWLDANVPAPAPGRG